MTSESEPIQEVIARWEDQPWEAVYVREDDRLFTMAFRTEERCRVYANAKQDIALLTDALTAALAELEAMKAEHVILAAMMDEARVEIERLRQRVASPLRYPTTETGSLNQPVPVEAALDGAEGAG